MNCTVCQDTGFAPDRAQSSQFNFVIGPCPNCKVAKEEDKGWHLKLNFNAVAGNKIERVLLSVMQDGSVVLREPLSVAELGVIIDKSFPLGMLWQTLIVTLSEVKHLQNRVGTLEKMLDVGDPTSYP